MGGEKKTELVFIPFPVMSHLVATVKTAKLLTERDERLSITVLIMKLPMDTKIDSYTKNSPDSRINFVQLPPTDFNFSGAGNSTRLFMESQKDPVRKFIAEAMEENNSTRIAGFVIDMFCTDMIDVGNEFGIPTYVYFTCGAATLGLMLHLQGLRDDFGQDPSEFKNSDAVLSVPTYLNPVPASVLPSPVFDKESGFLDFARKFWEAKGIIINTFYEFETHAIRALEKDERIPRVYPVGPVLQETEEIDGSKQDLNDEVMSWLDQQPDSCVLFLCFGTRGCFEADQVKEISVALEKSGLRFLWSLRKPPPKEKAKEFPGEYENPEEVLPEGFLERISGIGKVIGWAPQMAVLSHPAVGGFVSHCGWNSTLESIWCGVPVAVWPLSAEQQANAFQLVKEFGMAVEIKMDYRKDSDMFVEAEKIEKAIKELMDPRNEIRRKVQIVKEKSRMVLAKGGSSCDFLDRVIENMTKD